MYLLPGRVRFGFVWPVCQETVEARIVVAEAGPLPSAGDLVTEVGLTRHADKDLQSPDVTGVTPMPVTIEAIATGTELRQTIRFASDATDLERSCIAVGLDSLDALGGKQAAGMGVVEMIHNGDSQVYLDWLDSMSGKDLRGRLTDLAGGL